MDKKCFTVIELLVAIIIVVVLATLGMVNYTNMLEKQKGNQAQANLILIYSAEKRNKLDYGKYYACSAPCTEKALNDNLSTDIHDQYFIYSVSVPGSDEFTVTALRANEGPCKLKAMTIDQNHNLDKSKCSIW